LKKGKCSKGDKCPYNHETAEETASRKAASDKKDKKSTKKRKRQENSRPGDSGVDGPNYAPLTVRVFGLSYDSTEEDVRHFFKACGTIMEIDMPLWEDSGRSKGFCELKFLSEENVTRAVALDGDEMQGRWLRIQRGKMFSSWGVKKGSDESSENGGENGGENGSESGETKRKRIVGIGGAGEGGSSGGAGGNPGQSKTIFLGNLDWSLSKRALRRACDALYGKVTSVRMQKPDKVSDMPSGGKTQNTGYAHVTFAELETAEKAVSMNGEELLGRKATVDWA
jgi:nucleolin